MSTSKKPKKSSSHASAPGGFISFSDVASGYSGPISSPGVVSPESSTPAAAAAGDGVVYVGENSEIALLVRKVLKKDPTTRLKALRELRTLLKGCSEEDRNSFVSFFSGLYRRLIFDNSRYVRSELTFVLQDLMGAAKRAFTPPLMKLVIGPWWMTMSDPVVDIASCAKGIFESSIPPKKRDAVKAFLAPAIFDFSKGVIASAHANDNLYKGCAEEEAEERQNRTELACLQSLCTLLDDNSSANIFSLNGDAAKEALAADVGNSDMLYRQLWERVSKKRSGPMRSGLYTVIASLAVRLPTLTRSYVFGDSQPIVDLSPSARLNRAELVKLLANESRRSPMDALCISHALDAFIAMFRLCPELLSAENEREVSPIALKIISSLQHCFENSPSLLGEYLLPIMGILPLALCAPSCALSSGPEMSASQIDAQAQAEAALGVPFGGAALLKKSSYPLHRLYALLQQTAVGEAGDQPDLTGTTLALVEVATFLMLVRDKRNVESSDGGVYDPKIRISWIGSLLIHCVQRALRQSLTPIVAIRNQHTVLSLEQNRAQTVAVLSRILGQFQRVAGASITHYLSQADWNVVVWSPLAEAVVDVINRLPERPSSCPTNCLSGHSWEFECITHIVGILFVVSSLADGGEDREDGGVLLSIRHIQATAISYLDGKASKALGNDLVELVWAECLMCIESNDAFRKISDTKFIDIITGGQWLTSIFQRLSLDVAERTGTRLECRLTSLLTAAIDQCSDEVQIGIAVQNLLGLSVASENLRAVIVVLASGSDANRRLCRSSGTFALRMDLACAPLVKFLEGCLASLPVLLSQTHADILVRVLALAVQFTMPIRTGKYSLLRTLSDIWLSDRGSAGSVLCLRSIIAYLSILEGDSAELGRAGDILSTGRNVPGNVLLADLLSEAFQMVASNSGGVSLEQARLTRTKCKSFNASVVSLNANWLAVMTKTSLDWHSFNRNVHPIVVDKMNEILRKELWNVEACPGVVESLRIASSLQSSLEADALLLSAGVVEDSPTSGSAHTGAPALSTLLADLGAATTSGSDIEARAILTKYTSSMQALIAAIDGSKVEGSVRVFFGDSNAAQEMLLKRIVPQVGTVMKTLANASSVLSNIATQISGAIVITRSFLQQTIRAVKSISASSPLTTCVIEAMLSVDSIDSPAFADLIADTLLGSTSRSHDSQLARHVYLDTPIPGDATGQRVGLTATYIQRVSSEDIAARNGSGDAMRPTIRLVPARIASIHSDGPPETPYYYTLALQASTDEGSAVTREIQTEPHRVLLSTVSIGQEPQVLSFSTDPCGEASIYITGEALHMGVGGHSDDESGVLVVYQALMTCLHSMLVASGATEAGKGGGVETSTSSLKPGAVLAIPPSKLKDTKQYCNQACALIRAIGVYEDNCLASSDASDRAAAASRLVLSVCRGACVQYICSSSNLRALSSAPLGLQFLSALMSSAWGSGARSTSIDSTSPDALWLTFMQVGLWAMLHALNTASRLAFSQDEKQCLLSDISRCLADVLVIDPVADERGTSGVRIEWRFLREYVLKKVLQLSVPFVQNVKSHGALSDSANFRRVFMECMLSHWSVGKRADAAVSATATPEALAASHRQLKDVTSTPQWESAALAVVVDSLLSADTAPDMEEGQDLVLTTRAIDAWAKRYSQASIAGDLHHMLLSTGLLQIQGNVDKLWGLVNGATLHSGVAVPLCAAKLLFIWFREPTFLLSKDAEGNVSIASKMAVLMDYADQNFFTATTSVGTVIDSQSWSNWESLGLNVGKGSLLPSPDVELDEFVKLEQNDLCRDILVLSTLLGPDVFNCLLADCRALPAIGNVKYTTVPQTSAKIPSEEAPVYLEKASVSSAAEDYVSLVEEASETDSYEESDDDSMHFQTMISYLRWALVLQMLDSLHKLSSDSALLEEHVVSEGTISRMRDACFNAMGDRASGVLSFLLAYLLRHQPAQGKLGVGQILPAQVSELFIDFPINFHESHCGDLVGLNVHCLYHMSCVAPSLVRTYYDDGNNRGEKAKLKGFIERYVSGSLRAREIDAVNAATAAGRWNETTASPAAVDVDAECGELSVSGSRVSGEVIAVYSRDDASVEMHIKIPAGYPLRNVEVECTGRLATADGRWRRWVLQIVTLLTQKDGSIVDAVMMWRQNVDKEFEGVEPCPICYSTLHPKKLCLPTLQCATCKNKFHPTCLYTWFQSSGKSKCVICQQNFVFTGSGRK